MRAIPNQSVIRAHEDYASHAILRAAAWRLHPVGRILTDVAKPCVLLKAFAASGVGSGCEDDRTPDSDTNTNKKEELVWSSIC